MMKLTGIGALALLASLGVSFRSLFGFRKRCRWVMLRPRGEDLDLLLRWAVEGKVKPVVGTVVPLDQAAGALSDLSQGHTAGKTVVAMA